jgi:hypothetical protein
MSERSETQETPSAVYVGNFGLGGSPFLFGVLKRMRETWGIDFYKKIKWFCEGFNVIFIIQLLCGHSIEKVEHGYKSIVKKMFMEPNYCIGQNIWLDFYINYVLEKEPEICLTIKNKLYIGITAPFLKHFWLSEWENKAELVKFIKASYNIPIYCDRCEKILEKEVINGAYSCTLNDLKGVVLKISDNPHLSDIVCKLDPWDIYFVSKEKTLYFHYNQMGFNCLFERNDTPSKMYAKPIMNIIVSLCWLGKCLQIAYDYIVAEIIEC